MREYFPFFLFSDSFKYFKNLLGLLTTTAYLLSVLSNFSTKAVYHILPSLKRKKSKKEMTFKRRSISELKKNYITTRSNISLRHFSRLFSCYRVRDIVHTGGTRAERHQ